MTQPKNRPKSRTLRQRPQSRRPQPLLPHGLYYNRGFVSKAERAAVLEWMNTIYPIWEERYSASNPPPEGQSQRRLLRPVYWLGNWQFACLDYYHPPKGIENRCVKAEPFPPVLAKMVERIERIVHAMFEPGEIPRGWHLNTCLVNYYGSQIAADGKRVDTARVGEHKDFEPGPVASVSLGERALFQFVSSRQVGMRDAVVFQQWLDDGSLQIFGGDRWKNKVFHRVQRVDRKGGFKFPIHVGDFEPRRINFTFRYVPDQHVVPYAKLPDNLAQDVRGYMQELARHSKFFRDEIAKKPNI